MRKHSKDEVLKVAAQEAKRWRKTLEWLARHDEGPDIIIPPTEGSIVGILPNVHGADQVNEIIATLLGEDH